MSECQLSADSDLVIKLNFAKLRCWLNIINFNKIGFRKWGSKTNLGFNEVGEEIILCKECLVSIVFGPNKFLVKTSIFEFWKPRGISQKCPNYIYLSEPIQIRWLVSHILALIYLFLVLIISKVLQVFSIPRAI